MTKFHTAFERGDFDDYEHHADEDYDENATCQFCGEGGEKQIANICLIHKKTGEEKIVRYCLSCSEIQE